MKKLTLVRQNHNSPEFDKLYDMLASLKGFLHENANTDNIVWLENLQTIMDFQDTDGSFKLLDSFKVESDARVDFCYMPTYICRLFGGISG